MNTVKVYKIEFIRDAEGKYTYDDAAIHKFRDKMVKKMKRQNEKIAADPEKFKGISICDPEEYGDFQVRLLKHNFRMTKQIEITK